jgi:hypothetical protein
MSASSDATPVIVKKRLAFEGECWHALNQLALASGKTFQELADEAFRDLLRKHHRPATLQEALRQSARLQPSNDAKPPRLARRVQR